MISLKNINKVFYSNPNSLLKIRGDKTIVFEKLNLTLNAGELTVLLGPNGCGKTTIFKMISTILLPNSGAVEVFGHNPSTDPIAVRKMVSLVSSEERSFYFRLTGEQNLRFFGTLCDLKKTEVVKRFENIEPLLRLNEHMNKKYQEFSTGLKQKLNMARGLIRDFSILLLDEPVKSLDPKSSSDILKFVRDTVVKSQGKTVVMTTHNISEVDGMADRYVIINKGEVVSDLRANDIAKGALAETYKRSVG